MGHVVSRRGHSSVITFIAKIPNFDWHLLVPTLRLVGLVDEVEAQSSHVIRIKLLIRVHFDD